MAAFGPRGADAKRRPICSGRRRRAEPDGALGDVGSGGDWWVQPDAVGAVLPHGYGVADGGPAHDVDDPAGFCCIDRWVPVPAGVVILAV